MPMPRKHRWIKSEFAEAVASSKTAAEALRKMGLKVGGSNYRAFKVSMKEWEVDCSHFLGLGHSRGTSTGRVKPIDFYLKENSNTSSHWLRIRLIEEGLKQKSCEICKIDTWMGKECPLHLDHINGIHSDNRLENLRILCPNCHAQTPTYAGKNRGINN